MRLIFELNIPASLAYALLIFGLLAALKVGLCPWLKIIFDVSVSKTKYVKLCMLNLSITECTKFIQYLNWQFGMLNANWLSKAVANYYFHTFHETQTVDLHAFGETCNCKLNN